MNRKVFLQELEKMLMDISESERQEALKYYNDYLEDAGVENEEDAIRSLGTPKKVAENIKAGMNSNEEGTFTETGYQQGTPDYQYMKPQKNVAGGTSDLGKIGWIILVLILSPVIFGVAVTILALIFSAIILVVALVFAIFAIALAGIVAGVTCLAFGIGNFVINPLGGMVLISLGMIGIGIGLVSGAGTFWGIKILIPGVIGVWRGLWSFAIRKRGAI